MPRLRINSDFARKEGKHILLDDVCNAFYLSVAFEAAQQAGTIPWDEPFDHGSFLEKDEETGELWFGSIDARARAELRKMYEAGILPYWIPDI